MRNTNYILKECYISQVCEAPPAAKQKQGRLNRLETIAMSNSNYDQIQAT